MSKVTGGGQTMDERGNSSVNHQMAKPSAPDKHNDLYQSLLKGTVISLQNTSLH